MSDERERDELRDLLEEVYEALSPGCRTADEIEAIRARVRNQLGQMQAEAGVESAHDTMGEFTKRNG